MPVGPKPSHQLYLRECLESLVEQTVKPHTVVIIDDMANVDKFNLPVGLNYRIWESPWRLGVPNAFNFGVAVSPTEFTIMLGADDTLEPTCVEECEQCYKLSEYPGQTYFGLGVRYMDTQEEQYLACNAAMVTKQLWRETGGFAPESAVGACDTMLLSCILAHKLCRIQMVNENKPLYNYRRHNETDTAGRAAWQHVVWDTRDILTREWTKPSWGRYALLESVWAH